MSLVWTLSDLVNGSMVQPNPTGQIVLNGLVVRETPAFTHREMRRMAKAASGEQRESDSHPIAVSPICP